MQKRIHILTIVGPTASGKSDLAATIARKIHGEVISVDSRQVYKGMDIGTGKIEGERSPEKEISYLYKGIPHWGLDIASPKTQYSVTKFQHYAKKKIIDIARRGKTPILCGGTAHWMDAVIYEQHFPKVKPNPTLRKELESKNTEQLFEQLKQLDPTTALRIDPKNPRRLVRAIEIITLTGEAIPTMTTSSPYKCTWIGLKPDSEILRKNIEIRLLQRIKQGMTGEVQTLHSLGLSWKKLESFGLEYKYSALLLQGKISETAFLTLLTNEIWHYAKRQLTWWKRNSSIHWYKDPSEIKITEIQKYLKG